MRYNSSLEISHDLHIWHSNLAPVIEPGGLWIKVYLKFMQCYERDLQNSIFDWFFSALTVTAFSQMAFPLSFYVAVSAVCSFVLSSSAPLVNCLSCCQNYHRLLTFAIFIFYVFCIVGPMPVMYCSLGLCLKRPKQAIMKALSPIHTADADATKLFCRVASASAVCTWIRN